MNHGEGYAHSERFVPPESAARWSRCNFATVSKFEVIKDRNGLLWQSSDIVLSAMSFLSDNVIEPHDLY